MAHLPYFAYGTTQQGFPHHRRLRSLLGEPIGRARTVSAHAVVVPLRAACSNPGCRLVHRMAVLVPGHEPLRVGGDLFLVPSETIAALDRMETGAGAASPYVRQVLPVDVGDGSTWEAQAYVAREPARWHALVERGEAEALAAYPRDLATGEHLKDCCRRDAGHRGPHDVVDPLRSRGS